MSFATLQSALSVSIASPAIVQMTKSFIRDCETWLTRRTLLFEEHKAKYRRIEFEISIWNGIIHDFGNSERQTLSAHEETLQKYIDIYKFIDYSVYIEMLVLLDKLKRLEDDIYTLIINNNMLMSLYKK
jgi:hypothetical protein